MNIIITGASRGIGYETAKLFSSQKDNTVFIISRSEAKLKQLELECKSIQPESTVIPIAIDITQKEAIDNAVKQIEEKVDSIEVLINNAGFLVREEFEKFKLEDIDKIFNVNVIAPALLIQKTLPLLKKAISAHVVNVSSMAGFQGSSKFPGLAPYAASKSAIAGLTECLAEEFKESNVRFNALALGAVSTEMLAEAFPGYEAPTSAKQMAEFFYEFSLNGHKMFNGKTLPVSSSTP